MFHRLAREELVAAAQYLDEVAGLGAEFLRAYERWEMQIRRFPESGPLLGQGIRKGVLLRFHYLIAYEVRPDHVRVLYVRHAKRAVPDWTQRLQH